MRKIIDWSTAYMIFVIECITAYSDWAEEHFPPLAVVLFPIGCMAVAMLLLPKWLALTTISLVALPCAAFMGLIMWHFFVSGIGQRRD